MSKLKLDTHVAVLTLGGVGCFVLSLVLMGLAPWTTLRHVINPPEGFTDPYHDEEGKLTSIGRGRKLYLAEGCWHCHSQFVRPVAGEPFRYGPPSKAWETMFDVPQSFGTRRVGPDLSREAGRHSDDWHLAHLYNPRHVVPESIMPGYPWFFESGTEGPKPKQEATDLVAYLQYLGRDFKADIEAIVYPALFKVSGAPAKSEVDWTRGEELFNQNCIGCHGGKADGLGPAAHFLTPKPASFSQRFVSPSEIYSILNRGVLGSSMPSFREMPERDLWALATYVSSIGDDTKTHALASKDASHVEKGRVVFASACASCHGNTGAGDGPAAVALNPRPKDFTRRVFAPDYLKQVLAHGVPGSAMPPFAHLQSDEVEAVIHYLASLYQEGL